MRLALWRSEPESQDRSEGGCAARSDTGLRCGRATRDLAGKGSATQAQMQVAGGDALLCGGLETANCTACRYSMLSRRAAQASGNGGG